MPEFSDVGFESYDMQKKTICVVVYVCTKHTHAQTHIGFLSRGSSNESAFLSARHLAIHYLNFRLKYRSIDLPV